MPTDNSASNSKVALASAFKANAGPIVNMLIDLSAQCSIFGQIAYSAMVSPGMPTVARVISPVLSDPCDESLNKN